MRAIGTSGSSPTAAQLLIARSVANSDLPWQLFHVSLHEQERQPVKSPMARNKKSSPAEDIVEIVALFTEVSSDPPADAGQ
jgi:hypothetical protein